MKLKDLSPVLRSTTGAMQEAVVYDRDQNQDLAAGCSVDYAVKHYGEWWGVPHPECLSMHLDAVGIPHTIRYNGEDGRKEN